MKSLRNFFPVLFFCALAALPSFAASAPVRGASNNGVDGNAFNWNLFGPTVPISRYGGKVMLATQVVCTNQQVAAAVPGNTDNATSGTCFDGSYTFLFQIQSAETNLKVTIGNLVGFTPVAGSDPTYGLEVCDNDPNNPGSSNTLQLCTQVSGLDISGITATPNKKNTKVGFSVPSIPAFPAGIGKQGQGLTFVVLEHQTGPTISVPQIAFK